MDLTLLTLFIFTFASILVLQGPNAAFAAGQSLKYGIIKSLPVPLGFMAATGIHAVIVFSGLGLVVQKYATALIILKWLGVFYLIYMAFKAFTSKGAAIECSPKETSKTRMFLSAMLVSLTNPKAILASVMIYPLFMSAQHSHMFQAVVLSISAMAVSFTVYSSYSVVASALKNGLVSSRFANKVVGSLYLGAAGALALKQT